MKIKDSQIIQQLEATARINELISENKKLKNQVAGLMAVLTMVAAENCVLDEILKDPATLAESWAEEVRRQGAFEERERLKRETL